jgi:hypothetical protein
MADTTESQLKRLVLSATELRSMTEWPSALIEDYLNILEDLITLANAIDDISTGISGVTRVTEDYSIVKADGAIFADTDAGDINLALPPGESGESHRVVNVGQSGNIATLIPFGTERLNGFNENEPLYDSENLEIKYDETEGWF